MNYKYPIILVLSLLLYVGANAQADIDLQWCRQKGQENLPLLKQQEYFEAIYKLEEQLIKASNLPKFSLNGQATYQSEVIEFDLPIPNFNFDPISKDQYKVYADFKQTIWDGGISSKRKEIEMGKLKANTEQLNIEKHQLQGIVDGYYFSILESIQACEILKTRKGWLQKQLVRIEKSQKYGAAKEKDILQIRIAVIEIAQALDELRSRKNALINGLSILVGEEIPLSSKFKTPQVLIKPDEINRPELNALDIQIENVSLLNSLYDVQKKPVFYGFGQVGYGKPGFNMLKNEFDPYFIVGVGFSWKVFDWKETQRKKEINNWQQELIVSQKENFEQKLAMQLAMQKSKISEIEASIAHDENLIEIYKKLTKTAESELESGSITTTDYLQNVTNETVALLKYEQHKVELSKAIINYNFLQGE